MLSGMAMKSHYCVPHEALDATSAIQTLVSESIPAASNVRGSSAWPGSTLNPFASACRARSTSLDNDEWLALIGQFFRNEAADATIADQDHMALGLDRLRCAVALS